MTYGKKGDRNIVETATARASPIRLLNQAKRAIDFSGQTNFSSLPSKATGLS